MSINFPTANLVANVTTYTFGSRTWIWNGVAWDAIEGISVPVAGSANQVLYKDSTNSLTGNEGLTFDGSSLKAAMKGYSLSINDLGNISGSTTIDLNSGNFVTATVTGAVTFTFSGQSSSNASGFILELTNGGSQTINWPSVKWPNGTAPVLTASGVDVLAFMTDDNGSNWRGVLSMADSK